MKNNLVKVTIGFNDILMPLELSKQFLEQGDNLFILNEYTKAGDILTNAPVNISTLPSNFDEIVAGAQAMGTSYNDYKNNSQ